MAAVGVFAVTIGLQPSAATTTYPSDDAIYPTGRKRQRDEIVRFMETTVMPWARAAIGPLKDGPDKVACRMCHGPTPEARGWQMPAARHCPSRT